MEKLAEQLLKNRGIQATLYGVYDWGCGDNPSIAIKILLEDLNIIFDNIANNNPQDIINLMQVILDNIKYVPSEKKINLKGIYNLQQSLTRMQPLPNITVADFYQHCIQTECDPAIPFKHPNGWLIYAKPRDMMNYSNPSPYSEEYVSNAGKKPIEYGRSKCVRFYLTSETKEYSSEYFRHPTSEFWITTGLEYVDFDDCAFGQLESVFEWLHDNKHI